MGDLLAIRAQQAGLPAIRAQQAGSKFLIQTLTAWTKNLLRKFKIMYI